MARAAFVKSLRLAMNGQADAVKLRELLGPYQETGTGCPIVLQYMKNGACGELRLSDQWRVRADDSLRMKLGEWLRAENVWFEY
jgi:DNA polymerase-3 subunit alpha